MLIFMTIVGVAMGIGFKLISLTQERQMALYVLLIYGGIQFLESFLITPLILEKAMICHLLFYFFQVLFGLVQGALGLLLAAPILAVIIVIIRELWVKDVLEASPIEAAEPEIRKNRS